MYAEPLPHLFFTGQHRAVLPINPEKLPETKESDNGEYNVLGLGPVMQPRTPKLRKVTISGLFPGRRLPWMSAAVFLPPSVYITFFKSAMDQKRPIVYTPVRYYENGTPFLGGGMGLSALLPVSRQRSAAARPATFTLT